MSTRRTPTPDALMEALAEAGVYELKLRIGTGRRNATPSIGVGWHYAGHDVLGNLADHGAAGSIREALEDALRRLIDTRKDQGLAPLEHPAALALEFGDAVQAAAWEDVAIPGLDPGYVCSVPGTPGSSPACSSCTASCSTEPADVDPEEAALMAEGLEPHLVAMLQRDDGMAAIARERRMAEAAEEERLERRFGRRAMAEDFAAVLAHGSAQ